MSSQAFEGQVTSTSVPKMTRLFGWCLLAVMLVYLINNFLTFGAGLSGPVDALAGNGNATAWLLTAFYPVSLVLALLYVQRTSARTLREDSDIITGINTYFIRAAFWCVLIVGLVDVTISFLRVEGLLEQVVGEQLAKDLGRSHFRGPYVHMPLLGLSVVLAAFTRTLGFTWLALLIVVAELAIVFMRFIFSYEQAFMADLVRFWYGALFLFASAYTLLEEGHVRVDVFYAGFKTKTKALVNAICTLTMGFTLCWTILIVGMGQKSSVINSPIFNFETTQAGFGMYVKYMMAGFLGVFAVSMMIQFVSYLMSAVADYYGHPGGREQNTDLTH
ncbi:TRAP transporter small permease subunit [Coralliovum pocilloporae]|uniref:TRAP transporter small permease subunit n=1 Tax=Coralliovum pocilloporae TaxID=3066369 RepID=UPI003306D73C